MGEIAATTICQGLSLLSVIAYLHPHAAVYGNSRSVHRALCPQMQGQIWGKE